LADCDLRALAKCGDEPDVCNLHGEKIYSAPAAHQMDVSLFVFQDWSSVSEESLTAWLIGWFKDWRKSPKGVRCFSEMFVGVREPWA
jgi:hypothetical protein